MSRKVHGPRDWSDGSDDARLDVNPSRPVQASVLTGSGLVMLALLIGGIALLARDSPDRSEAESTRSRFHHLDSSLEAVAFAPDGQTLALGHSDGTLEVRDLAEGRRREFEPGLGISRHQEVRGLAFSPDGKTLASGGQGTGVKLWDVATGERLAWFEGHLTPVHAIAFSPDGQTLASGSADGTVKLWDVESGRELAPLAGHSDEVRGLAFGPDGKTLASGSFDGTVKIWDLGDGHQRSSVRDKGRKIYSLAFSPDGKSVAFGLGAGADGRVGQVILWNVAGGREAIRIIGDVSFASVAFSPDGKTLAGGGGDRVVHLWDAATGRQLATLAGHEGYISSLAFSPDGRTLVTAGMDALVGLFEICLDPTGSAPHRL